VLAGFARRIAPNVSAERKVLQQRVLEAQVPHRCSKLLYHAEEALAFI
jgi:hypothetical protein